MQNKIIILMQNGQWMELENCLVVGAVEYPDKVVYHKFLFTKCEPETRNEMLSRAEQYINDAKKGLI
jgi:hypothetical protein